MTDTAEDVANDSPGVHLFANLALSLEGLTQQIAKANEREQRRLSSLPINMPLQQFSNAGAATTNILDFMGPQPGRVWVVRLLSAYATPVAANATVCSWYVGQVMPGDAAGQLPITMKRWEFSSLPGQQTFTSNVLTIRPGEHLIAGLTGLVASSRIALNVAVNDMPEWAARFAVAESES